MRAVRGGVVLLALVAAGGLAGAQARVRGLIGADDSVCPLTLLKHSDVAPVAPIGASALRERAGFVNRVRMLLFA